jgi:hypothetical protein
MPQIKIGFDRIPIPETITYEPLYDIVKGVPLRDANNKIIVTEQEGPVEALSKAENSLSVTVNNDADYLLGIEEQFAETSEVSTTLLGIPRAEVQLSLFSDVSTYGRNPEEWEFFNYNGVFGRPAGWYSRRNPIYGNHYSTRLIEEINEQALVIESFPVAYTFAPGPRNPNYNEASFERFKLFIDLGNILYQEFVGAYPEFAETNFLPASKVTVADDDIDYIVEEQEGYDLIEKWCQAWMNMRDGLLLHPATNQPITFPDGFDATNTRPGASGGARYYGKLQSKKAYRYQPGRISGFTYGFRCSRDEASTDNIIEWGIGNPTDQYIFQVRGPEFNIVRRSTVRLPDEVVTRMGFQPEDQEVVTSSEPFVDDEFYELVISRDFFNGDPVNGNGPSGYLLEPTKVTMYKIEFGWYGAIGAKFYAYVPVDNGDARWVLLHTLTIENQLGEPCLQDPYFRFIYVQDIRNTTNIRAPQYLYKYGASCYIDGGDNSAGSYYEYSSDDNVVNSLRHISLAGIYPKQEIKNQDGVAKPNKKNVFPVDAKIDCDQLTEINLVEVDGCPAFGHHYAPSLHAKQNGIIRSINISGNGNDFTINPYDTVNISTITNANPVIVTTTTDHGYYSGMKATIENVVGMTELNFQTYYVDVLNDTQFALFSDANLSTPVDGSVMGTYTSGGTSDGNPILRLKDDDSKLIANGIWSTYVTRTGEDGAIFSRVGPDGYYEKSVSELADSVLVNGQITALADVDTTNVRFSNYYDAIAGSLYPITGDGFDLNFLNPVRREGTGQFCEFMVGVTENKPIIITENDALGNPRNRLGFLLGDGVTEVDADIDDLLTAEFTQSSIYYNRDGYEQTEGDAPAGVRMDIDYRLPRPAGDDSGICSGLRCTILDRLEYTVSYTGTNPVTSESGFFIIWEEEPTALLSSAIIGGEFGKDGEASGIRFTSDISSYVGNAQGDLYYYAEIDGDPNSGSFTMNLSPIRLETRTITGSDEKDISKTKIFSFQPKPLYVTIWLRDNARVNNITITESINGTTRAFCPDWITNDGVDVVFSGSSQSGVPAANYLEKERLASTSVDTQNTNPLRPGQLKDTLYVSPLNNNTISLDSIYGPDRTTISPGLLNTTATFVTGRSMINNDLNLVSISLTTKEE